jgi:hypothetical protein
MKRLFRNIGTWLGALLITVFICLNAETERMVEVTCSVPVHYVNLPDSLVLVGGAVDMLEVRAVFSRRFWQTRPDYLTAEIDLSDARRGTERIATPPEIIQVPPNRKARPIEVIAPERILLTFEPKVRRRVPVSAATEGTPSDGYALVGAPKADPSRVFLTGPQGTLDGIREARTAPLSIAGATEDVRGPRPIDLLLYDWVKSDPVEVQVVADIERIEDRVLHRRPVRIAPRDGLRIQPATIDLVVRGPSSAIALLQEERTRIHLDASVLAPGDHTFNVEVAEGNRLHFFTPTVPLGTDGAPGGREIDHAELFGEVQNLPDELLLVDAAPKSFTLHRGGR